MFEQLLCSVVSTVQESSVAPGRVVDDRDGGRVFAAQHGVRFRVQVADHGPARGIGPLSRVLLEGPLVFAGQEPWPDSSDSAKLRHWPL